MSKASTPHRWRFFRAGGLDQVRFESAEDYRNLEKLDQKLWVALACPVRGTEFDEKTLALIDSDGDGRVRAMEVLAAIRWTDQNLKDLAILKNASAELSIAAIQDQTASGKMILASARHILKSLGKADAAAIALSDVADTAKIFVQTKFNGDGVVPADSSEDPAIQKVIEEIIATQGAEPDRSGRPGVSQAKVEAFFEQATALNTWAAKGDAEAAALRPLGEATAAALDAVRAVACKVDDYFGRCRLAAFDPRAVAALNRKEEEYLAIAAKDMNLTAQEVAGFPLSRVEAGRALPLKEGINPAWSEAVDRLRVQAIEPALGKGKAELTEAEWVELKGRLAGYEGWLGSKPAVAVESLGLARIREILGTKAREEIGKLIAKDKAVEAEYNAIADVEKLIRFHRDLYRLLNNFVNFSDFYSAESFASFQVGTLYLDARACKLCVRVDDSGKHAALAGLAKTYLAYCDCTRPTGEKMTIAAAFTDGDSDNLMVGRNGVFYDRKGRDWDATITKVIDNPISIRQAFWAPYKKLVRMIEEQVAKRAAAAEAGAEARLTSMAAAAANVDKAKPGEAKKIDVGTVAALGVAFGAIGTAVATVAAKLMGLIGLPFWQVILAFAGLLLIVSGPSMLIAWLKLRQRNLGPILDANGWAVNGRVRVPVSLGHSLTSVAKLPAGTLPAVDDKFAEPPVVWPKLILFLVVVGFLYSLMNHYGFVYRWTGGKMGTDPRVDRGPSLFETITGKTDEPSTNAPAAK